PGRLRMPKQDGAAERTRNVRQSFSALGGRLPAPGCGAMGRLAFIPECSAHSLRGPTMKVIWSRIEAWLKANAPAVFAFLRPGASARAIAQAETVLGVTLPADVCAFYRIHDGADSTVFIEGWELLSLERIADEWRAWKELLDSGTFANFRSESDGRTLTDWWSPSWVPLTYSGSGDHHSLDLAP